MHQLAVKGKAFYLKHKDDVEFVARQAKIDEFKLQKKDNYKRRWTGGEFLRKFLIFCVREVSERDFPSFLSV